MIFLAGLLAMREVQATRLKDKKAVSDVAFVEKNLPFSENEFLPFLEELTPLLLKDGKKWLRHFAKIRKAFEIEMTGSRKGYDLRQVREALGPLRQAQD